MDCGVSSSVIYVIVCCGCGEQYIGETGDTLRHRMTVHRQQILDQSTRKLAVSKHINEIFHE